MKVFTTLQVPELDAYTISNEPIASIDLMERAAVALFKAYLTAFNSQRPVCIIAGPGNNGGDALALGRLLKEAGVEVQAHLLYNGKLSNDCKENLTRFETKYPKLLFKHLNECKLPSLTKNTVIIDGLFGAGLNRELQGIYAETVAFINQSGCEVVAIDIPSGLQGEQVADKSHAIVQANYTFSLQFPKLAFFLPENEMYVGEWRVLDIGIHPEVISQTPSSFHYLRSEEISPLLKNRNRFSHKGTFGHCLIIAGSRNMAGAVVLSGKAALRTGTGLVTLFSPECNRNILQTSLPEALFNPSGENYFSETLYPENHHTVAIGPGLGTSSVSAAALESTLKLIKKPCVLDADALNLIAQHPHFFSSIPTYSIITPHPKEFDRMFGTSENSLERIQMAARKAIDLQLVIVLKGAHTLIACPEGNCYFNSTGNSGMATAGSGDVLTGMLVSLLAQGYQSVEAALIGVYLHGLAGDLALENESQESLIASDLIENLGKAFKKNSSINIC